MAHNCVSRALGTITGRNRPGCANALIPKFWYCFVVEAVIPFVHKQVYRLGSAIRIYSGILVSIFKRNELFIVPLCCVFMVGCSSSSPETTANNTQNILVTADEGGTGGESGSGGEQTPSAEPLDEAPADDMPTETSDEPADESPVDTPAEDLPAEPEVAADADLLINSSNFERIAAEAVSGLNLIVLEQERVLADELFSQIHSATLALIRGEEIYPGLTLASQEPGEIEQGASSVTIVSYTCDDGGALVVPVLNFNGAPVFNGRMSFDGCVLDGHTYSGTLASRNARRSDTFFVLSDYVKTTGDRTISITGEHITPYAPAAANSEAFLWQEASVSVVDADSTLQLDNLAWERKGLNSNFDGIGGFVILADGTAHYVKQHFVSAELTAGMTQASIELQSQALDINANLDFTNSYFDWVAHELNTAETPDFPLSDLGPTIDVIPEGRFPDSTDTFPQSVGDKDAVRQWENGEISIVATDNSTLSIRPDAENTESVLMELNGSGESVPRAVTDGYQIDCPAIVEGCGM